MSVLPGRPGPVALRHLAFAVPAWSLMAVLSAPDSAAANQPPAEARTASPEVQAALDAAEQALQHQQWALAELWLERVIMLQPDHLPARLAWAQLLIRRGEVEAGRALLESLQGESGLSAAQRQRLQDLLAQAPTGPAPLAVPATPSAPNRPVPPPAVSSTSTAAVNPPGPWRTSAEALIGHSRNPLVQPASQDVVLTLPQGNLVLPLISTAQPASVWGFRAVASNAPRGLVLQGQIQGVAGQGDPSARIAGLWSPGPQWGLFAQAHRLTDGSRRVQAGAQWVKPFAPDLNGGIAESRQALLLQSSGYTEPGANRQGVAARATLLSHWAPAWQSLLWAEREINRRPDGPPGSLAAGLLIDYRPRKTISITTQVLDQKDDRGFSPLLNNNAPRRLTTLSGQMEIALGQALGNGAVLRIHAGRRLSNLPLFSWEDAGAALLWRAAW